MKTRNATTLRNRKINTYKKAVQFETLEQRQLMAVDSMWMSGNMLVVRTDHASTNVTIEPSGSQLRIVEGGTSRSWSYNRSSIGTVEIQGGNGNDRFINNIANLPVRFFGGAGNDYLEGYDANDILVGGDGNDTLVGYGGDDQIWGGTGNDRLLGGAGNDRLYGEAGNDHLEGGAGNDMLWGGDADDTLLGGDGDDQLMGGDGADHLNGQGGLDKLWGGNGNDVLIAIDAVFGEYVDGGAGADTLWIDAVGSSRDSVVGLESIDKVQAVSSFANGADRTLNGDRIVDPTPLSGHTHKRFANNPLFSSSGSKLNDIVQGGLGDCYFLAGLGAIALDSPHAIRQNIVDFNDGTYGVRFGSSFYRVDDDLAVTSSSATNPAYAKLGSQNSMWVALYEKAFAHFRRGQNSYASLVGGWSVEVNRAFGSTSAGEKSISSYSNATALANDIAARYNGFQAVTVGFTSRTGGAAGGAPLLMEHMYTVAGIIRNSVGTITGIRLRNPWGTDGAGNDGINDGYVTVTPAQLFAQPGRVNYGRV